MKPASSVTVLPASAQVLRAMGGGCPFQRLRLRSDTDGLLVAAWRSPCGVGGPSLAKAVVRQPRAAPRRGEVAQVSW
eukprot:15390125-Alexandrium_andersonii.AAC.1